MLYGPKAVTEKTGIPPSTLRRYSVEYADQLSETARHTGGKRRYTEADILTLTQIRSKVPPGLVETTPQNQSILPVEVLQLFDSFSAQLAKQENELQVMRARLDQLAGELEEERKKTWWDRLRGK